MPDPPEKRVVSIESLLGIAPCQPGRNAFAEADQAKHRYMQSANAFYALKYPPPPPTHPTLRDSNMTTMSQFMGDGPQSPPLNLGTTPDTTPQPTQRAFVEEYAEQRQHQTSGSTEERVPVFRPTPNLVSDEFGQQPPAKEVKFAEQASQLKSPKKNAFFAIFRRRTESAAAPPPAMADVSKSASNHMHPKAAAVLATNVHTPKRLARSPSKTKAFFRRRTSDASDMLTSLSPLKDGKSSKTAQHDEPPPRSQTSTGHYSATPRKPSLVSPSRHIASAPHSDAGSARNSSRNSTPHLGRSLATMDGHNQIPPTPPSKDTPPDEKAVRNVVDRKMPFLSFKNSTPTKTTGFVTVSEGLSPTKYGSYATRVGAKLVTQPSSHSLRASVVPGAMDRQTFEDVKSRVNGLGLAGMDMPAETHRQSQAAALMYSPSVYSPELGDSNWGRKSFATFERVEEEQGEGEGEEHGDNPCLPSSPLGLQGHKKRHSLATSTAGHLEVPAPQMLKLPSGHSRQDLQVPVNTAKTTESSATIEVAYPELAKDPSIASFMNLDPNTPKDATMLSSIEEVQGLYQNTPITTDGKRVMSSSLFYSPGDSPMPNHPSAQVSPLQPQVYNKHLETLPATVYTPAPKIRKAQNKLSHGHSVENLIDMYNNAYTPTTKLPPRKGSGEQSVYSPYGADSPTLKSEQRKASGDQPLYPFNGSASGFVPPPGISPDIPAQKPKHSNLFDNKPFLPMEGSASGIDREREDRRQSIDIDPKKSPATSAKQHVDGQQTVDNVTRMINERKKHLQDMTDNAQRMNARLEARLSASEGGGIPSDISGPIPTIMYEDDSGVEITNGKRGSPDSKYDSKKKRISTNFARDFYGNSPTSQRKVSPADTEASTIILTPNLPHGGFPRTNGVVTSSTLVGHSIAAQEDFASAPETRSSTSSIKPASASSAGAQAENGEVRELKAMIKQQQDMMQQMMAQMQQMSTSINSRQRTSGSPPDREDSWFNPG
ncbi:uncharacterized protein CLAFUR5_06099 [Fulvia fulva]|uniref:Uncharacterized protein n=1 Tax=Passalora fulva TaxID=5499 RepID=A0A9Q8LHJ9_PASFU|nr:uncharacterized protein CLAFUR5_06099 [Fulvia fulva]KAK4625772.1 hypothetical protein CLAFUR0_05962 [Fulvia fulva]UJO17289.1 hypothetical protein CLAFUR5_06099 [Fulvia fulva]